MKVKDSFFDRKAVADAAGQARVRALSKSAAYVWRVARNLIRKRKAIAQPGQPPSSHAGNLKKLIFFAYDPGSRSAVIGPVLFKDGEAPRLLEFGGTVTRKDKSGKTRTLTYRPHPFMAPALEKSADKLPGHWANSVRAK